jgi:hypothetical protein
MTLTKESLMEPGKAKEGKERAIASLAKEKVQKHLAKVKAVKEKVAARKARVKVASVYGFKNNKIEVIDQKPSELLAHLHWEPFTLLGIEDNSS